MYYASCYYNYSYLSFNFYKWKEQQKLTLFGYKIFRFIEIKLVYFKTNLTSINFTVVNHLKYFESP